MRDANALATCYKNLQSISKIFAWPNLNQSSQDLATQMLRAVEIMDCKTIYGISYKIKIQYIATLIYKSIAK